MLPSPEFIWKVFVSLFAIVAGIVAMYLVCASALCLIVLAVDLDITWAKKQGRAARSDVIAKASIGFIMLVFLGIVFWMRH